MVIALKPCPEEHWEVRGRTQENLPGCVGADHSTPALAQGLAGAGVLGPCLLTVALMPGPVGHCTAGQLAPSLRPTSMLQEGSDNLQGWPELGAMA